jgi:ABC-type uncharacterized transport system substrate-binding protein
VGIVGELSWATLEHGQLWATARLRLLGLVEHVRLLARPGGNLTGVTCMTTELSPKRLELLKEVVPNASRVMFLHDPEAAPNAFRLTQEAAPRLGVTLQVAEVGAPKSCYQNSR